MSSIIKVDTIQNQSGANIISESSNVITVGASGDTITVPSGATLGGAGTVDLSSATVTLNSSMKNTPAFAATLASQISGVTTNTWTKLPLASEIYDTNNCFDNVTNYRFTPNVAGKYWLSASFVAFSSDNNLQNVRIKIYKNGAVYVGRYHLVVYPNSQDVRHFSPTIDIIDEANGTTDYYEVYYYISGSTLYVSVDAEVPRGNIFQGFKIIE